MECRIVGERRKVHITADHEWSGGGGRGGEGGRGRPCELATSGNGPKKWPLSMREIALEVGGGGGAPFGRRRDSDGGDRGHVCRRCQPIDSRLTFKQSCDDTVNVQLVRLLRFGSLAKDLVGFHVRPVGDSKMDPMRTDLLRQTLQIALSDFDLLLWLWLLLLLLGLPRLNSQVLLSRSASAAETEMGANSGAAVRRKGQKGHARRAQKNKETVGCQERARSDQEGAKAAKPTSKSPLKTREPRFMACGIDALCI